MSAARLRQSALCFVTTLLLIVNAASAAVAGVDATICTWGSYDFSSLVGVDYPGSDGTTTYTYELGVCGGLLHPSSLCAIAGGAGSGAISACQTQTAQQAAFDVGNWPTAGINASAWSYIDEANPQIGVQYTMQGASQCWNSQGEPQPYVSNVQFVCANTQGVVNVSAPVSSCIQNYTLPTPLACSGAPPPHVGCTFEGFDFSSLMGADLNGTDGDSENEYAYYLRVCGVLSSSASSGCTAQSASSSACQVQAAAGTKNSSSLDLGNFVATTPLGWTFIEPGVPEEGVQYTLTGADTCTAITGSSAASPQPYFAHVQFVCAEKPQQMKILAPPPQSCTFTFVVATPLACTMMMEQVEQLELLL